MVFGAVSEATELLVVFTVFLFGILITHLLQRWSDKSAGEE
ncbi:hypothetical protein BH20CHL1_BH20CHL1_02730 [soil metagenome]|jgi:hypothetical protein